MTYKTLSVTFVMCDQPDHVGDPVHTLAIGPGVTAVAALKQLGWHYSASTNRHWCPDCWSLVGIRN